MDPIEEEEPKPLVDFAFIPEDNNDNIPNKNSEIENFIKNYHKNNNSTLTNDFGKNSIESIINSKIKEFYQFHNLNKNPISNPKKNLLPLSHCVSIPHTINKSLTSLDIDHSCNLLATSSFDGTLKIFDFNSLTRNPIPIHTIDLGNEGEYPISKISFSCTGGFILVCSNDCQAKILNRNGGVEITCIKGDNYLIDINNTHGHTYPLTDGKFHPNLKNIFITSSRDGTVRLWDVYSNIHGFDSDIVNKSIFKIKTERNKKFPVSSCNFNFDGKLIISGVDDGSIQIFSENKTRSPEIHIKNAHEKNSQICSVLFNNNNNNNFYSRCEDSTMKIWDIRKYEKPIHIFEDLNCINTKIGIGLSNNNKIIFTGTSVMKNKNYSEIKFYDIENNYDLIENISFNMFSITDVLWQEKLNQIFIGSNDGYVRCFFDFDLSKNGVIQSVYKKNKIKEDEKVQYKMPIITPLKLPLFEEKNFNRKTYLEKIYGINENNNKFNLNKIEEGVESRQNIATSMTRHIMHNINKTIYNVEDSQKMLLKFKDKKNEGIWVDKAYKNTQPENVIDQNAVIEDVVEFYEKSKKKKCPKCGLKFCTCNKSSFQIPISKLSFKKNNY